jgi:hypothetical protein
MNADRLQSVRRRWPPEDVRGSLSDLCARVFQPVHVDVYLEDVRGSLSDLCASA